MAGTERLELTRLGIRAGVYEALVTDPAGTADPPEVVLLHQSLPLPDVALSRAREGGGWHLHAPIPADLLSDGVQSFLVKDDVTGDTLDSFTIVTGTPLEDDIRAEVMLLRDELDLLKRAFRRHCLETVEEGR